MDAVRALIIASGVVLTVGSIATAMPVANQPHLWHDTIQIHGCHHGYSHDLGGWHRHGKDCQRLRGIVGRKTSKKAEGLARRMSALGQKQTCAVQKGMSALHPMATAKAKFRNRPCLLYPRKRT